ncbi:MAG: glucose 1-dehydrogenase [Cytophagaceae bacterium]|jgi:NAD(P)-dependent dehydrogenase (short-subunit alcohol dehydrogenase family)|nr:glucose 1-dehydrogenase [Cytophagaceae bacterium]
MAFSLQGKVALITGGGTGLGFGMARCMKEAGATVVITGRREEVLQQACQELGEGVYYRSIDLNQTELLPALVDSIENEWGSIDILVNNAGINNKKSSLEMSDAEFDAIMNTNVRSVFALTREVARGMVQRQRGSIIMISSMSALYGLANVAAYGASKSAIAGMTRVLASEYSPKGVRINSIAPGFIDTPMLRKAIDGDPDRKNKILGRTPMNCFGTPDDIGYAAVYLASDEARFITGTMLVVDGGNSIGF